MAQLIKLLVESMLAIMIACSSPLTNSEAETHQLLVPAQNEEGLWGYVYEDGTTALPYQWQYADHFRGTGYALVMTIDGIDAIVHTDGSYAVEPDETVYITADMDGEYFGGQDTGVFWLDNGDKIAFFDVETGYLSDFCYSITTDPWFNGADSSLLRVTKDGDTYGYVNRHTGEEIIPYIFSQINLDGFHNGYAIEELASNERLVIVREDGNYLYIPSEMEPIPGAMFEDGLLLMQDAETGYYGYCDANCKWVINPTYEDATSFDAGVASVNMNGSWSLINVDGNVIETNP